MYPRPFFAFHRRQIPPSDTLDLSRRDRPGRQLGGNRPPLSDDCRMLSLLVPWVERGGVGWGIVPWRKLGAIARRNWLARLFACLLRELPGGRRD